ncbi:MAG: aspartate aminotransferase family protein [Saprospiraceae bacterium]
MPSLRQLHLEYLGQTSEFSLMLEVDHAKGMYIFDINGKSYLDLNSGISVSSLGHCHPAVVKAIKNQSEKYLHTMVYGEHVQSPQIKFAKLLLSQMDKKYECLYYLMAGTEAVELSMKIAKKATGRYGLISCSDAYHGSTQGAESLRSDLDYKNSYFPLIPGVSHIRFNNHDDILLINERTAGVIIEAVQAEAGVIPPNTDFLKKVEKRCRNVGAIFIMDEIQTGFGRTGHLFAHQKYGIIPDLILIGKAMGGGMPIAGVVGGKSVMNAITKNPALGHITTFGGHPISSAAAHACLNTLLSEKIVSEVFEKELLFHDLLKHNIIKEVRSSGLMMAVELTKRKYLKYVVNYTIENGALVDYFLFNDCSFRLAPPLIINEDQIRKGCKILLSAMDYAEQKYQK